MFFFSGEQLVNHIPNCNVMTNKMGLLNSLHEYEKVLKTLKSKSVRIRLEEFFPETYKLDDAKEKENFINNYKGNW